MRRTQQAFTAVNWRTDAAVSMQAVTAGCNLLVTRQCCVFEYVPLECVGMSKMAVHRLRLETKTHSLIRCPCKIYLCGYSYSSVYIIFWYKTFASVWRQSNCRSIRIWTFSHTERVCVTSRSAAASTYDVRALEAGLALASCFDSGLFCGRKQHSTRG